MGTLVVDGFDTFQVVHEPRQIPHIAQKTKYFLAGTIDRNAAFYFHPDVVRDARALKLGGAEPQILVKSVRFLHHKHLTLGLR